MRLQAIGAFLILVGVVHSQPSSRQHRSPGTFQSNDNPYEVVLFDGQTPTKYHDTVCGTTLKEIAVLEPLNTEKSEFTLKRILIEVESGKPASGPCAEAILETYEREDALRPPIVLKKRGESSSSGSSYLPGTPYRPLSAPSENHSISKRKCQWIRRPVETPSDQNPFALRRRCRPRREPKPCSSSPWKSEQPCKPNQPIRSLQEVRVAPVETVPYPYPPPFPRKCTNRRNQITPSPLRRPSCRRDPSTYPCNHPNSPRRCVEPLTPHSLRIGEYAEHRAARTLVHFRNENQQTIPRREPVPVPIVPFKRPEEIEPSYTNLNEEDRAEEEKAKSENTRPRMLPVLSNYPKTATEKKLDEVHRIIQSEERVLSNMALVFPPDVKEQVKEAVKEELREEMQELKVVESELKQEVREERRKEEIRPLPIDEDFVLPKEDPIDTEYQAVERNVDEETLTNLKPDYSAMERESEEMKRKRVRLV